MKKKRTTIFLDENKDKFLKNLQKQKKLKSRTAAIEFLINNYENRLSNHIARTNENLLILAILKLFNIKNIKEEDIKKILNMAKKIEKLKIKVLNNEEE